MAAGLRGQGLDGEVAEGCVVRLAETVEIRRIGEVVAAGEGGGIGLNAARVDAVDADARLQELIGEGADGLKQRLLLICFQHQGSEDGQPRTDPYDVLVARW